MLMLDGIVSAGFREKKSAGLRWIWWISTGLRAFDVSLPQRTPKKEGGWKKESRGGEEILT